MKYDFHPESRLEYLETAIFYERIYPGLGAAFTLEVEGSIQRILDAPERFLVIEQDVRRCLTHSFPYSILYTIEQNSILIVAVMHFRREPGYWRQRLDQSSKEVEG
ncbi:MAG: type II toxin-antitoxin system RelE/ParE family toxin [Pyrinomonadaceae bacterium]